MARTPTTELSREEKRAKRDAAEADVLLREVDEAVRQGDFEAFVSRWGKPIIGLVLLILAAFGAYLYWQNQQEAALERDSEALVAGLDSVQAGNLNDGYEKLGPLADSGKGAARAAARMMRAGIALEQGRREEAAKLFGTVAADTDTPAELRDLARLREITINYDSMDKAKVVAALKPLAIPGKAYFGSAGELLGHAYLDLNKKAEAGAIFAQVAKDDNAPESLRSRARQMAGVLGVDAIEDVDQLLEQQGVVRELADGEGAAAPTE
ncbi:tetratricopeptide repeat protein [Qipengyuania marisflavi]|uniref:Tetratricopeptide repeat protein n=1 Tax=Qipengyuania marisflavi TaxID=2486356 RepID=A0A5S3P7H3_9SPHN|nr:tetratricopeptide repeat protein [Qipengyuania marisflavi]TMM48982.1 tetratricopeptide repeat protein [Qipengyuania marisflavi]